MKKLIFNLKTFHERFHLLFVPWYFRFRFSFFQLFREFQPAGDQKSLVKIISSVNHFLLRAFLSLS